MTTQQTPPPHVPGAGQQAAGAPPPQGSADGPATGPAGGQSPRGADGSSAGGQSAQPAGGQAGQHASAFPPPGGAEQFLAVAATAVTAPIAVARRVLPAKGGLPLYAGLGGLAIVGVIEWPVALAAGAGYGLGRLFASQPSRQDPD